VHGGRRTGAAAGGRPEEPSRPRKAVLFDPSRAAASTWVFAVARNLRADTLRRERPRTALAGEAGGELPPGAAVPDAAPGAEKMLAAVRLRDARRALPKEQARVLELSYFGYLSHAEIGRHLGVPLGTVKGRLRLVLARLRAALEGDEP
jgi:RNA polymerase sigma-70 factor, ECF subfamily